MAGKLKIAVLYDRWEPAEDSAANGKAPLVRTLDKKEVEEEVLDALTKLGHEPTLHQLDGSLKSLHAVPRLDCDLIFNLSESFAGNDTADYNIAAYLELAAKRFTGTGSHGLMLAQDKSVAKKIFAFHGIHTPIFARSFRGLPITLQEVTDVHGTDVCTGCPPRAPGDLREGITFLEGCPLKIATMRSEPTPHDAVALEHARRRAEP